MAEGTFVGTVVFAGPSLAAEHVQRRLPGATVHGPASRGDILRAARDGAKTIGLVDGYFEHQPPVWHKEVLFALETGCRVLGSSSMGAIRAAELSPFGMEGVGVIHDLFEAGIFHDPDVALAHGPAPEYRSLSEPFANVYVSLHAARDEGLIDAAQRDLLLEAARGVFYPDRTYASAVGAAAASGLDRHTGERLRAWLAGNAVDQKRLDAEELVDRIGLGTGAPTFPEVTLNRTHHFEAMCAEEEARHPRLSGGEASHPVAEEARLDPAVLDSVGNDATLEALAAELAAVSGVVPTQQLVDETSDAFRRHHGLRTPAELEGWLEANQLDWDGYAALVRRRALAHWGRTARRTALNDDQAIVDALRATGAYPALAARAHQKGVTLARFGYDEAGSSIVEQGGDPLEWYFGEVHGGEVPEDLALAAGRLGFGDESDLVRSVRREHAYRHIGGTGTNPAAAPP